MGVAVIDFVLIGIIIIFTLRCAVRGFVSELLSVAALVFGLLLAIFFFRAGAVIVRRLFMPDVRVFPEIISFIAIFLIVYIVVKILELILKSIIDGIRLGGLDRLLGFAFGLAEGIIVVCLLLFLINIQPFVDPEFILGESFFARILLPFITGDRRELLDMPGVAGV